MTQDDHWYRSADWNDSDRRLFYEKIARSRSNFHKQQYARIKAYSLIDTGSTVTLHAAESLLRQSLQEWQCEFPAELSHTYAALGDVYNGLKNYTKAAEMYEKSITWDGNTIHPGYWSYPELIVTAGLTHKFDRAFEIMNTLHEQEGEFLLDCEKFIYHGVRAIVLQSRHQIREAREDARIALSRQGNKTSLFRFHAEIGAVDIHRHKPLIALLKTVAK
jgi:tetratricopeptide (TPR) repeat protein